MSHIETYIKVHPNRLSIHCKDRKAKQSLTSRLYAREILLSTYYIIVVGVPDPRKFLRYNTHTANNRLSCWDGGPGQP